MWDGWQLLGRRYWHLSVGFLYKSVEHFTCLIDTLVSKNGTDWVWWQKQSWGPSMSQKYGEVNSAVNLIVGWRLLIPFKNVWSSSTEPVQTIKMSSRKRLYSLIGSSLSLTMFLANCLRRISILFMKMFAKGGAQKVPMAVPIFWRYVYIVWLGLHYP